MKSIVVQKNYKNEYTFSIFVVTRHRECQISYCGLTLWNFKIHSILGYYSFWQKATDILKIINTCQKHQKIAKKWIGYESWCFTSILEVQNQKYAYKLLDIITDVQYTSVYTVRKWRIDTYCKIMLSICQKKSAGREALISSHFFYKENLIFHINCDY